MTHSQHLDYLEVGYVGSRSTHLLRSRLVNQAELASAADSIRGETTNTVANIPDRVGIVGWTSSGINEIESADNALYNGLEVSLTKKYSYGTQFLASYTFSKTLDTDAAAASLAWGGSGIPGDQLSQRAGYGVTDFDRRHRSSGGSRNLERLSSGPMLARSNRMGRCFDPFSPPVC